MKPTKRFFLIVACVAFNAFSVMSQNLGAIQDGAEEVVDTLAVALPFNTTIGLNWSDAYIGQLLGVPPHFGFGVSVGATTVEIGSIDELLAELGYSLPAELDYGLPLPAAVAEARIGGFLLPFDIGIKAGYIPESTAESISDIAGGLTIDYLLVGADLRFALLKGNLIMPSVSLGLGFNYMKGGLGTTIGGDQVYSFDEPSPSTTTHYLRASSPEVGLLWESTVVDLKAQISKSLLIFTPYLGAGASYGNTTVGYDLSSDIEYSTDGVSYAPIDQTGIDALTDALETAGFSVPDLSDTGLSYESAIQGWAFRAFGGLSINLLVIRLDVSGLYNFSDGQVGGSIGLRVQL